jgi:hypothetical protein
MSNGRRSPAEVLKKSQLAKDQGLQWLAAGAGVGAIGALGAMVGAVCPLCVVATPALLGAGLVRTAWAKHLERRAKHDASREDAPSLGERAPWPGPPGSLR